MLGEKRSEYAPSHIDLGHEAASTKLEHIGGMLMKPRWSTSALSFLNCVCTFCSQKLSHGVAGTYAPSVHAPPCPLNMPDQRIILALLNVPRVRVKRKAPFCANAAYSDAFGYAWS